MASSNAPQPLTQKAVRDEYRVLKALLKDPAQDEALVGRVASLSPDLADRVQGFLELAIELKDVARATALLPRLLDVQPDWVHSGRAVRDTAFHLTFEEGRLPMAWAMLRRGADPMALRGRRTALAAASMTGDDDDRHAGLVRELLARGTFDAFALTEALGLAAGTGSLAAARALVEHGAALVQPDGWAQQEFEAEGIHDRLRRRPLAEAALMASNPFDGENLVDAPLRTACRAVLDLLLTHPQAGLALQEGWDHPALEFRTPLHCAAYVGDASVIGHLVAHGAAVNPHPGQAGAVTPLMVALGAGRLAAARALLALGADPHAQDAEGRGAFHHLTDPFHHRGVQSYPAVTVADPGPALAGMALELYALGVDPLRADHRGRTPLDDARLREHPRLVELFLAWSRGDLLERKMPVLPSGARPRL